MSKELASRLCLGTVQFGLDYGIANKRGAIPKEEAFSILEAAYGYGIDTLDTAYAYGQSEEVIGEFISESGKDFSVISKLPHIEGDPRSAVEKCAVESLRRLRRERLSGYLVHGAGDMVLHKELLWGQMESLKKRGMVEKIGVSLYKPEELEYLLRSGYSLDMVQVPYSILDQRFKEMIPALRAKGIEVYARSVFLQGLIFMDLGQIAKRFKSASGAMTELHTVSLEYGVPVHALAVSFVFLNKDIDKVVFGVDSLKQFEHNMTSLEYVNKVKSIYHLLESLELEDEKVIIPYNWEAK